MNAWNEAKQHRGEVARRKREALAAGADALRAQIETLDGTAARFKRTGRAFSALQMERHANVLRAHLAQLTIHVPKDYEDDARLTGDS